jgi:hypothetical protein
MSVVKIQKRLTVNVQAPQGPPVVEAWWAFLFS